MRKRALLKVMFITAGMTLSLSLGGCRGNKNENANANGNSAVARSSPPATTSASEDTALRNKVEANLTKYNVTGVSVDVSNGEVTLRGNVQRAKLQDAMKAANEAVPKKVNNQMNIQ